MALLRDHGYAVVRMLTDMVMDLHEPIAVTSLPDEGELRPVEPTHDREIYGAYKDAMSLDADCRGHGSSRTPATAWAPEPSTRG